MLREEEWQSVVSSFQAEGHFDGKGPCRCGLKAKVHVEDRGLSKCGEQPRIFDILPEMDGKKLFHGAI